MKNKQFDKPTANKYLNLQFQLMQLIDNFHQTIESTATESAICQMLPVKFDVNNPNDFKSLIKTFVDDVFCESFRDDTDAYEMIYESFVVFAACVQYARQTNVRTDLNTYANETLQPYF